MEDYKKRLYHKGDNIFLKLEEGEVLFREGDTGENMYIISKGSVKVYRENEGGEIVLNNLGEGDFFGEMSLLENMNRSANVKANEPTTLMVLEPDGFEQALINKPWLVMKLLKGFSGRLRKGNERLSRLINELDNIRRDYD